MAPPGSTFDKLFASGFGAVIKVAHASQIVKDKSYEQIARRGGFTLNAIDSAKAIARKNPAISEETVATGMLSASPAVPEEDVDTIGLEWLLVAQSRLSTTTVERPRADHLREQGRARARRRLRLQDRAGGDRQGRLHRGASGRRRIHQRRNQVLHRALQRPDVCCAGRAQHHRLDLCRHLHQGHPDRAGKGQPARDRHSRYRRAHGIRQDRSTRSTNCRTNWKRSCAAW